jgi:hypothetical protein
MRLSTASGKNFNFNNGNIGIATTAIGTNNKIIVNPYSTVDNLATVQINTNAATNKGLVVQGYTSQSANLQEWQDSTGSIQANVNNVGIFNSNNATGYQIAAATYYGTLNGGQTARVQAGGSVGANPHLVVRQSSGATGNLQEWQDSTGAVLSSVSAAGLIRVNNTNTDAMITATGNSTYDAFKFRNAGGLFLWGGGSNNNIYYASTGTFALTGGNWVSGRLAVDTGTTSSIGIVVRGQASQTANLQEWQDSTGYVMAKLASAGQFVSEGGIVSYSIRPLGFDGTSLFLPYGATGYLTVNNPAYKVIIVKGAASQTANLQEWQNSAGTVLINVDSTGNFSSNSSFSQALRFRYLDSPVIDGAYIDTRLVAGTLGVVARSTTAVTFIVRGTNSQTGDLQEWQNSSGTKIAWIDKDGNFINGNNAGIYNSITTTSLLANGGNIISTYGLYNGLPAQTNAGLAVRPWAADVVASIIRGYTSQTADLTQWQNSTGTTLGKIDASGNIALGNSGYRTNAVATFTSSGAGDLLSLGANNYTDTVVFGYENAGSFYLNGSQFGPFSIRSRNAGSHALNVRGYASQTGDLQQWQNSSGTVLASINSAGDLTNSAVYTRYLRGGDETYVDAAALRVKAYSTSVATAVIKGSASQTANLQEWQSSAGTILALVDAYGRLGINTTSLANSTGGYSMVSIYNNNTVNTNLTIKSYALQTANLTEWQNNSGTVLAKVDALGNFTATSKSFDIIHPTKENMRLRYGSLEGPENGVYIRGTAQSSIIELPEYWTGLVHEDSITVSLTSVGSAQNIYVEKIENNKVYIGGDLEKVFFTVYGERKDIDKLTVEY